MTGTWDSCALLKYVALVVGTAKVQPISQVHSLRQHLLCASHHAGRVCAQRHQTIWMSGLRLQHKGVWLVGTRGTSEQGRPAGYKNINPCVPGTFLIADMHFSVVTCSGIFMSSLKSVVMKVFTLWKLASPTHWTFPPLTSPASLTTVESGGHYYSALFSSPLVLGSRKDSIG